MTLSYDSYFGMRPELRYPQTFAMPTYRAYPVANPYLATRPDVYSPVKAKKKPNAVKMVLGTIVIGTLAIAALAKGPAALKKLKGLKGKTASEIGSTFGGKSKKIASEIGEKGTKVSEGISGWLSKSKNNVVDFFKGFSKAAKKSA